MTDRAERRSPLPPLVGAAAVAHAAALALCLGSAAMIVVHTPPLARMVGGDLLPTPMRGTLLASLLGWTAAAAATLGVVLWRLGRRTEAPSPGAVIAALWPLSLLPLAFYVFDTSVWGAAPLLLFSVTTAACGYCVLRTELPRIGSPRPLPDAVARYGPPLLVAAGIAAYSVAVSLLTIVNHRSLGTAAFDLAIHENMVWNTLDGHFFYSSLMGGSYLGVHTSFVELLVLPFYAAAPVTETLLVIQTVVLGVAAWPLYLAAHSVLTSRWQAALLALIWLSHPAMAGANFYDFHAVAFAPVALFTAYWLHRTGRRRWFWAAVVLVLSVKEEMAIVVVLLGIVIAVSGRRRRGAALVAVGAATYIVLQHLVIPHFAGGSHSYAWYYSDMIPAGEGPFGLVTTVLTNPLFALGHVLTAERMLYLLQIFAPLALLPFATGRGIVLVSYGLASTLLASRPPLHTIGFQYALALLAMAFLATLLALERLSATGRRRALVMAAMLAVVTCFHYGMIWPRHNFRGGFHTIDFTYSAADRARYAELCELVATIPPEASVLASETLAPHVARRRTVGTARYAAQITPPWDAILLHNDRALPILAARPQFDGLRDYEVAAETKHFVLLLRRDSSARSRSPAALP